MRKASVRETDGRERRREEEKTGGEGVSFLLLINYFHDKRWPVEKRGGRGRARCRKTQVFSLALTLCSREAPRTNF